MVVSSMSRNPLTYPRPTQEYYLSACEISFKVFAVVLPLPGDANRDGQVNAADLRVMVAAFGTSDSTANLNADVVDILTLS